MIRNTGNEINTAGLKISWNALMISKINLSTLGFKVSYDIREDDDALERQGILSIAEDVYAFVDGIVKPTPVVDETETEASVE